MSATSVHSIAWVGVPSAGPGAGPASSWTAKPRRQCDQGAVGPREPQGPLGVHGTRFPSDQQEVERRQLGVRKCQHRAAAPCLQERPGGGDKVVTNRRRDPPARRSIRRTPLEPNESPGAARAGSRAGTARPDRPRELTAPAPRRLVVVEEEQSQPEMPFGPVRSRRSARSRAARIGPSSGAAGPVGKSAAD